MNIKIADEYYDLITEKTKFSSNKIENKKLKERVKKLFRAAYVAGFKDGLYEAEDQIIATMSNLHPH